jgi:hypothetical protein
LELCHQLALRLILASRHFHGPQNTEISCEGRGVRLVADLVRVVSGMTTDVGSVGRLVEKL